MATVPQSLRTWFKIHFAVDMLFATPMMVAPVWTVGLLGFPVADPFTTRLVAAALFAIGGVSLLLNKQGLQFYRTMLTLKLLWSSTAVVGLVWTTLQTPVVMGWVLAGIFAVFFVLWMYYYRRIS